MQIEADSALLYRRTKYIGQEYPQKNQLICHLLPYYRTTTYNQTKAYHFENIHQTNASEIGHGCFPLHTSHFLTIENRTHVNSKYTV